jgi:tRNA (adenine22-N1)-methyltransferase
MVTEGNRLADVGTDHGYVPIYLKENGRIPSAIAMDINRGPLERADSHIRENGLDSYIQTRLSDGLGALRAGEADTVLIAGMGGLLTVRILTEGKEALAGVRELILQPQSEIAGVRRWLAENGWQIVLEDMVLEDGKFYPMFRAVPGRMEGYSEDDCEYGRVELQRSPDIMKQFLEKGLQTQRQIAATLPRSEEERIVSRRREVEEKSAGLKRVLGRLAERKGE